MAAAGAKRRWRGGCRDPVPGKRGADGRQAGSKPLQMVQAFADAPAFHCGGKKEKGKKKKNRLKDKIFKNFKKVTSEH